MKKKFRSLFIGIMLSGVTLMAQKAPFKISIESFYNPIIYTSYPRIHIISVEDNLNIKNVIVNKGHCQLLNGRPIKNLFPKKLHYSQEVEIPLSHSCNILRIDVETNQGTWSTEY